MKCIVYQISLSCIHDDLWKSIDFVCLKVYEPLDATTVQCGLTSDDVCECETTRPPNDNNNNKTNLITFSILLFQLQIVGLNLEQTNWPILPLFCCNHSIHYQRYQNRQQRRDSFVLFTSKKWFQHLLQFTVSTDVSPVEHHNRSNNFVLHTFCFFLISYNR